MDQILPYEISCKILYYLNYKDIIHYCMCSKSNLKIYYDTCFWLDKLNFDISIASHTLPSLLVHTYQHPDHIGHEIYKRWIIDSNTLLFRIINHHNDQVIWYLEKEEYSLDTLMYLSYIASLSGNMQLLQYMKHKCSNIDKYLIFAAIKCGDLHSAKLYISNVNDPNIFYNSMYLATKYGHINILEYVIQIVHDIFTSSISYTEFINKFIEQSITSGHLHVLEWYATQTNLCIDSTLNLAITSGHTHIVSWLLTLSSNQKHTPNLKINSINEAAMHGYLDILQLIAPSKYPNKQGADLAAMNGHLHVLQWLEFYNVFPTINGVEIAKDLQYTNIVTWCTTKGIVPSDAWNDNITKFLNTNSGNTHGGIIRAMRYNRLDIIKLAIKRGLIPNIQDIYIVCDTISLDVLNLLEKYGVIFDAQFLQHALDKNRLDIWSWLDVRGITLDFKSWNTI